MSTSEPPPTGPPGPPEPPAPDVAVPAPRRTRPKPAKAPAKKSTRRIAIIAGTAALTTAVSGIVGGIVSPERVQAVLGLSDDSTPSADATGSSSATPTETTAEESPPALEFKRVQDSTGTISLDVPSGWATADSEFGGIDGIASVGLGLRVGPDPTAVRFVSQEVIWVGASSQAFDDLNLDDYDEFGVRAILAQRREAATYLAQAGCVPTPTGQPDLGDRWFGAARVWQDCSSVDGWRAVEIEAISAARDAYVFVQIGLAPGTPDEVSQRVVDSLTILAANLPTG